VFDDLAVIYTIIAVLGIYGRKKEKEHLFLNYVLLKVILGRLSESREIQREQ